MRSVIATLAITLALFVLPSFVASAPTVNTPIPAPAGWEPPKYDGPQEQHGMGLLPSEPGKYPVGPPPAVNALSVLPASVDLSYGEPPVGDQGDVNSCTGWSSSYYYKTFQEGRNRGWNVNLVGHIFSPLFIYNQLAGGQNVGLNLGDVFNEMQAEGDDPLSVFPYETEYSILPSISQVQAAASYPVTSLGAFFQNSSSWVGYYNNDIATLKQQLANGDTFVLGIPIYSSFQSGYSNWACQYVYNGPYLGDSLVGWHAIQVVGYNDTNSYFRVINSWGTSWGCNGYGYLSYSYVQHYATEAWWMVSAAPATPTSTPSPTVIATATPVPPSPTSQAYPSPYPAPNPSPYPGPITSFETWLPFLFK